MYFLLFLILTGIIVFCTIDKDERIEEYRYEERLYFARRSFCACVQPR